VSVDGEGVAAEPKGAIGDVDGVPLGAGGIVVSMGRAVAAAMRTQLGNDALVMSLRGDLEICTGAELAAPSAGALNMIADTAMAHAAFFTCAPDI